MINVGKAALYLSAVISVALLFVMPSVAKDRRKADALRVCYWWLIGVFGALTVAIGVLLTAFIAKDYGFQYAASYSSADMALQYRIAALWAGSEGSMLLWAWMLAGFTAAIAAVRLKNPNKLDTYALIILNDVQIFFLTLLIVVMDPFVASPAGTTVGQGINPLLMHWAMIFHPPTLFVGYAGLTVPFAYAMAAAWTRDPSAQWVKLCQRWSIFTWLFLSIGIFLGALWAYVVLGWGGYWGWDPVENASLVPWLIATPFLHSVIMQENRGMLKRWNMALIILTFLLVIWGTFTTRSGIVSSVHSFAQSPVGPLFFGFIAVMFVASFILFMLRWDDLGSDNELDSLLSRESFFLLNNLVFTGLAFIVWWGTNFPLFSEALIGERIVVGPPFFEKTTGPLWAIIVLLMGVAPLIPWRRAAMNKLGQALLWPMVIGLATMAILYTVVGIKIWWALLGFGFCIFTLSVTLTEYWRGVSARHRSQGESYPAALWKLVGRNRRRYGGYLIHIGVILIAIGVIGSRFYQVETQRNLAIGESMTISSEFVGTYKITYHGLREGPSPDDRLITEAVLTVTHNGRAAGNLTPTREFFVVQQQPMTIPDKRSRLTDDLYVILAGWEGAGETATFKAYINPLVNWLWLGGFIVIPLGTLIAGWPNPQESTERVTIRAEVSRRAVPLQ